MLSWVFPTPRPSACREGEGALKRKKGQKLECVFIWRDKLWRSRRPHSRSGASDPPRREEEGDTEAPHPREGGQVRSLQLRHLAFHQQPGPVRAWGAPSLDLQLSSPSSLRPSLSPRPSLRWALGPSRPPTTPVCPPGQELTGRVVVRPGVLLDSPQTLPTSRASQPTFHVPAPAPLRGRPPGPDPPRPQGRLWPPPRFSGRACTGPAWYGRPLGPGRSRVRWWGARDRLAGFAVTSGHCRPHLGKPGKGRWEHGQVPILFPGPSRRADATGHIIWTTALVMKTVGVARAAFRCLQRYSWGHRGR